MYLGLYQGSAAMTGLEKWQALISQNLANSSVAGYKGVTVSMQGESAGPQGGRFGQVLQNTIIDAKPKVDFAQGQFVPTDNPLDVAIDGDGFFEVEQPDGRTLLTRDGQFHVSADNILVNKSSQPVIGAMGDIQLVPGGGAPRIDLQGRVFQGLNQVGRLSVVQVGKLDALEASSGGFIVKDGQNAQLQDIETPRVLQGHYETSNVSPVREMVNLIAVTRAYEANEKVIQTHDRQLDRAIQTFSVQ